MALGVIDDEDFEAQLRDCNDKAPSIDINSLVINPNENKGRNTNDVNVPDSLRSIIGETSEIDGRKDALALADSFGISASSVSAYANGVHSTKDYNKPKDESIIDVIRKSKTHISKRAIVKVNKALNHLDDIKLSNCTAVELAQVAKSMTAIVSSMSPDTESKQDNRPQIIQFFAPAMRTEQQFETIVVKD